MDENEKLKKLLPHWIEHNNEHAENFMIWSEKVSDNKKLSGILKKLYHESKKLNTLFEEALNDLENY